MKNIMINDDFSAAYATKKFLKNAKYFGTPEWEELRQFKAIYPEITVTVKPTKKSTNKAVDAKNMTYENMKKFISTMDNPKVILEEFETVCVRSKIQKNPYRYVLAWFMKKYEDYTSDYNAFFESRKDTSDAESDAA